MAERLRVLLVTDAVGGVWDHALSLAGGLLSCGKAHVLLAVAGPSPTEVRLTAARSLAGLEVRSLPGRLEWMEGGRESVHDLRQRAAALAAAWRADVVHVNQLSLAGIGGEPRLQSLARRPAVVLGVHSDLGTWWRWVKDGGRAPSTLPEYLAWQRDLAWHALRQADAVVCPSAFLAGEMAACYELEQPPRVIHNAVQSPEAIQPAPAAPSRDYTLGVVAGRAWDEAKNLALVAEALRLCRQPWRVEVAGDTVEPGRAVPSSEGSASEGSASQALRPVPGGHARGALAAPAPSVAPVTPSAPGLYYLGFLDKLQLERLYRRAGVYIAPSSYEPFGLAAAEAALAGCAVLANDIPSYREIWGERARYFARNDARALAQALDQLYGDEAEITRMGSAARQWVAERYTVERMVEAYLEVYHGLHGRARASTAPARRRPVRPSLH